MENSSEAQATSSTPASIPIYDWATLKAPKELATGTTTIIYSAKLYGTPIAAKLLRKNKSQIPHALAASDLEKEATQNAKLRHPNIVQFLGAVSSPTPGDPPGLVFELASGGKLKCAEYGPSRLTKGLEAAICIARALAYAHGRGVMHRDVKPSQVMFCAGSVAKLGDWGLARPVEGDTFSGETGTWEYMAPEVIRSEQYNEKADVYSFGVLLHGIACGLDYPYENEYLTAAQAATGVAKHGLRPAIAVGLDEGVKELIRRCWADEAAERPKMEQVVPILEEAKERLDKQVAGSWGWW